MMHGALLFETTARMDFIFGAGPYAEMIQSQTQAASALGFRGTPAFVINGKPLVGAQPFEGFQKYIDEALEAVSP